MRLFLAVGFLVAACYATTPLQDFVNKIVNSGVKFPSKANITAICNCMSTPIFQLKLADELTNIALQCVMDKMAASLGKLQAIYQSMESCLTPLETNTMNLVMKLMASNTDTITPIFNNVTGIIKACKAAKGTKDSCMNKVYKWGINQFNKTIINNYCTKLVKSNQVNKGEWKCILTNGKNVVDFTPYSCAKLTPTV